ncbi:alpha/beta-type small acid-soluble spore protein [Paenibacillus whitsoniae]|uniref:Alpha/beta-type small acid-soluble spore protein n=1 Tax=Paenibacillus whitsoniae TaxID=2496558 RepID=A0A3S0CCP1_9BACL|nr:alpha/beta-type small acid-soluble spore protein [Paenibacillus whitsoniae]RTE09876.1 alpha/beta-type small acid-soluble spore protein [Paenibacillus whitsoniae]
MARRRSSRAMVPGASEGLGMLKAQVMKEQGYAVDPARPDLVKYEVARTLGVPLQPGYNGQLKSEDAGRVGGPIGGAMVRELVRMAQQQLAKK